MNVPPLFALLLQAVPATDTEVSDETLDAAAMEMSGEAPAMTSDLLQMVIDAGPLAQFVLLVLLAFSIFSWAIAWSKWGMLRKATKKDSQFLSAFRRVGQLAEMNAGSEQFRPTPMVTVFDYGYKELARQVNKHGSIRSPDSLERAMQLGANEETARLTSSMGWLATTASATPFIGLFGTVWGVLESFRGLGQAGGATLRAVAPGIAEALIATAAGLFAAIPALIFYNHFSQQIREIRGRMHDFALEFFNIAERDYGEPEEVAFERTRAIR